MKKTLLLTAIVAFFAATFLTTSCTDSKKGPTCYSVAGRDTGAHTVFIDALNPGLAPIRDTLDATVTGSAVSIHSTALGRTLTGKISSDDCNTILLDSIAFTTGDTLRIPSTLVPSGMVKIWGIVGTGTGTITSTGATTKINISKGNTNITSPINLTNLAGLKLNLRGTFLKLH